MRSEGPRPTLAGPDTGPTAPFPIRLSGPVVKGFGRGSKELGIPTANIPIAGLSVGGHENIENGVYFGYAGLAVDEEGSQIADISDTCASKKTTIREMVMSIGWNPYYKNTVRSVEVHILHPFRYDFYGARLNLIILGFIRQEYDYISKESLIDDINIDIQVTHNSLARKGYNSFKRDEYLTSFDG